jgi:hypothetical protein
MMMLVIEFHIWHLIFECKLSWFLNGSTIWSFCYSYTTLEMRYSKAILHTYVNAILIFLQKDQVLLQITRWNL